MYDYIRIFFSFESVHGLRFWVWGFSFGKLVGIVFFLLVLSVLLNLSKCVYVYLFWGDLSHRYFFRFIFCFFPVVFYLTSIGARSLFFSFYLEENKLWISKFCIFFVY